ncbi:P2X purinoceptor 7-like [Liolophura sinensis]|uniref:P2X purinoceptor 7-like n=1 Tax=Liolophura sinensis TaxID=3198878 RepID=UPI0031597E8F
MADAEYEESSLLSKSMESSSSSDGNADFDEEVDTCKATTLDINPYMFEPEWSSDGDETPEVEGNVTDIEPEGPDRRENTEWCTCGQCHPLDSQEECICCQEISRVVDRIELAPGDEKPKCITEHPGFQSVVLDRDVLETAYYVYRQQYGPMNLTHNSQYRYVAYRQLCRWCWKWLGKRIRVVLPACCVHKILQEFPLADGEQRTGYRDPH